MISGASAASSAVLMSLWIAAGPVTRTARPGGVSSAVISRIWSRASVRCSVRLGSSGTAVTATAPSRETNSCRPPVPNGGMGPRGALDLGDRAGVGEDAHLVGALEASVAAVDHEREQAVAAGEALVEHLRDLGRWRIRRQRARRGDLVVHAVGQLLPDRPEDPGQRQPDADAPPTSCGVPRRRVRRL